MKLQIAAVVCLTAAAFGQGPAQNWVDPNHSEPAGTHYRTFHSQLAGSDVSYLVYLPPDYDANPSRRYPVVYWLHGYGGNPRAGAVFVTPLDAAIRAGKTKPMIAVLVNGLAASFYSDSRDGKTPVDSVIVKELIPHIDATYRTIAKREARAVEGFSMGGYGAAHLGFAHPDLFGMVSVRSGALTDSVEWGELKPPQGGRRQMLLNGPKDYFEANDLATIIRRNAGAIRGNTQIRIAVGSEDPLRTTNQALHRFLTQLKIEHEYQEVAGAAHDSRAVYSGLGDAEFAWYAAGSGCQGVAIHAGEAIPQIVAAHPPSTTYCIGPGLYRLTESISPKAGDRLIGAPGAILNGSKPVTNWMQKGSLWIATGQTQHSESHWKSTWPPLANPPAQFNEDLFLDGKQLRRVLSTAEVVPGTFYFDYDAATIYIADPPAGHELESSAVEAGVRSKAPGITVQGLTIEKFTSAGISLGSDARIENNETRYIHGLGIQFSSGARVVHNKTHHNGMYGMTGAGESPLVEDNEIAYNNTAGYHTANGGCWAAGGAKYVYTRNMVVRGNYVHDNYCAGLWSDIDNIDTTYENNRIENNWAQGLFIEISYRGAIRNNVIRGNFGTGILFNSSSDQDVSGNQISDNGAGKTDNGVAVHPSIRGDIVIIQQNRGSGRYGDHLSKNIFIHDNNVTISAGVTGATKGQGNPSVFTQNNRFENNHYFVPDINGNWWVDPKGPCTWTEWRALGNDAGGSVTKK
jgi:endo-1,4-beta-xylanase